MVLEGIASALIKKLAARFIKDFKQENLRISLRGEICIDNFELRMDEIVDLQLPIEPKSVFIGHLRTNVLAAELTSQPLHIQLADVVLLVGTPVMRASDSTEAMDFAHQSQIDWLVRLLDEKTSEVPVNGPSKTSLGWFNRFRDAFVSIERLHLRFEDTLSSLSFGIQVDGVVLQPPRITSSSSPDVPNDATAKRVLLSKTIALTNLSMYVQRDHIFESAIKVPTDTLYVIDPSQYILEPCNITLELRISQEVQLQVRIEVPHMTMQLPLGHLQSLNELLESLDLTMRRRLYRRFRPPTLGVKSNAGAWWRYAITAVLLDLQDPVRHRPSWRQTLNLIFLGLQYTALRRYLAPYIVRKPWRPHDYFLHYKEELAPLARSKSAPPIDAFAAVEYLPRSVTHYSRGVYAGVYGLGRRFAARKHHPTMLPPEELVPLLFTRQQYLDACFRPIVVAKLRRLALDQCHHQVQTCNRATKRHNQEPGVLTITLVRASMELDRFPSSASSLFVVANIKVGARGVAYMGPPVHASTSPRTCGFPFLWRPQKSTCDCILAQTFEFHLRGSVDEDALYIELLDRWPIQYLNQSLATASISLLECTSGTPMETNTSVVLDGNRGQLHVLTSFVPSRAVSTPFPTSQAMLRQLYPSLYHKEEEPFQAQLGTSSRSYVELQCCGAHVTLQDITQLDLRRQTLQCFVETVDVLYGGASSLTFSSTPSVRFSYVDATNVGARTLTMQLTVPDVAVALGLPVALRLYLDSMRWSAMLSRLVALLASPIYGPFGLWVAPAPMAVEPPKHASAPSIDTTVSMGAATLSISDFASVTLPALQCDITTCCNDARTAVAINGRSVATLIWDHWSDIQQEMHELLRTDVAPSAIARPPSRPASAWFLKQGIGILQHDVSSKKPQERVLYVDQLETTLFLATSRWASSPTALPLVSVDAILPGIKTAALRRSGLPENADLYLSVFSQARVVSVECISRTSQRQTRSLLQDLVANAKANECLSS
ncbi:hypothetical protein SPRG_09108 [Saprolegnia parasitica CBS 223.65]|uniref:Chorein N-terminal domain-containing protein n=1 Tax=Saprolegnia parasitica (strain CBS 223.65) TaxID=695850 RepID=A0A067C449_SAPPC|nr:hypothetical protein SPRG_09108 [Saprolegnia parasitica CBS 223.65]KDO25278.1 hypothetical protein SPRG_09108 [Saprolegnia parasitica CBS 223.65]|eukprot:XP_012203937.1 hypothetical protein SPRG_09108 [Saprolegnia parasitica CBS 223.65]